MLEKEITPTVVYESFSYTDNRVLVQPILDPSPTTRASRDTWRSYLDDRKSADPWT